jgi:hypothetical protein
MEFQEHCIQNTQCHIRTVTDTDIIERITRHLPRLSCLHIHDIGLFTSWWSTGFEIHKVHFTWQWVITGRVNKQEENLIIFHTKKRSVENKSAQCKQKWLNQVSRMEDIHLTNHHAMKTYWEVEVQLPRILNLWTIWRPVVSFTQQQLYLWDKRRRYPLDRRLGWPQSRSGRGGEKKTSQNCPYQELNPGHPDPSLV